MLSNTVYFFYDFSSIHLENKMENEIRPQSN